MHIVCALVFMFFFITISSKRRFYVKRDWHLKKKVGNSLALDVYLFLFNVKAYWSILYIVIIL